MVVSFDPARMKARMVEDGAKILDDASWLPATRLQVKTQPWWGDGAKQQFGFIKRDDKLTVHNKDAQEMNDHFDSISALVEKWSVD